MVLLVVLNKFTMAVEFKFPDVGEGIAEGEIVKWLAKEGDIVKADDNIVQIETDKAVADLPAPVSGRILKINFKEGDKVKVGEVLCVIGNDGEKIKEQIVEKKSGIEKNSIVIEKKISGSGKIDGYIEDVKKQGEIMKGEAQTGKVLATPAIRKLAMDLKIDLSRIKGSGTDGRVLKGDLGSGEKAVVPQQNIVVKRKYDDYGYIERVPLKGIRKTIADNMIKSQNEAAQVTAMEDIDVSALWKLREKEKRHFEIEGIKLTFLPFIVKACIAAMKENPILNSAIEDDEIIIKKYFNIGIAVETDVGLMVPVVKIAESKSIAQIAKEIQELAEKSRNRTIDLMEMHGSTFTITNWGSVGGTYGTPILNPGNAAILGMGRIFDRAVYNEKKGKVRNVKILPVSLTFDHRILDGAQAARFLESLKRFLEDVEHLFGEVK